MRSLSITIALAFALGTDLVSGTVWAQSSLTTLEEQARRLAEHQQRLERRLDENNKRIRRLKQQAAGLGRDLQLREALRESLSVAKRLTDLARQRAAQRQALIVGYKQRVHDKQLTSAERQRARARISALMGEQRRSGGQLVAGGTLAADASAEELEERADLLADSEAKVRRELKRVQRRLAQLKQRRRLWRHHAAASDGPFVEGAPRRTTRTTVSIAAGATNGRGSETGSPSPGAVRADPQSGSNRDLADQYTGPPSTGARDSASEDGVGAGTLSIRVHDVVDPALLNGVVGRESFGATVAALQQAEQRLERLAGQLQARSEALRHRAKARKRPAQRR